MQKCAIVSGCSVAVGTLGFYGPLVFDRDVGGALAARVLEIAGLVIGGVIGMVVVRRRFD